MNYTEFLIYMQQHLQTAVGTDFHVLLHKVLKNNGTELDGISILEPKQPISPTIYLNDLYQDYLNGESPDHILREILLLHNTHKANIPFDVRSFRSYEQMREKLALKLIHYDSNQKFLSDIPHQRFFDLSLTAYILLKEDEEGSATISIRQEHLNLWNITKQQLFQDAMRNSPSIRPAELIELNQLVNEYLLEEAPFHSSSSDRVQAELPYALQSCERLHMYVLTNCSRFLGASALLYPDILSAFAERMNSDLFILPSSIHEVILVPDYGAISRTALDEMVQEVNEQEVAEHERLSDHIYIYHRTSRSFSM